MDERVVGGNGFLLEASEIIVRNGCYPARVVLLEVNGQFVVHMERLIGTNPVDGLSCRFEHSSYDSGEYFHPSNFQSLDKARAAAKKAYLGRLVIFRKMGY